VVQDRTYFLDVCNRGRGAAGPLLPWDLHLGHTRSLPLVLVGVRYAWMCCGVVKSESDLAA